MPPVDCTVDDLVGGGWCVVRTTRALRERSLPWGPSVSHRLFKLHSTLCHYHSSVPRHHHFTLPAPSPKVPWFEDVLHSAADPNDLLFLVYLRHATRGRVLRPLRPSPAPRSTPVVASVSRPYEKEVRV